MISKPYILTVEDNIIDITLMKRVFNTKLPNLDYVFFEDTDIALQFLNKQFKEKQLPELILLDIKLIKSNGLDLLQTLKKSNNFKHITIIMLSSSDRLDDKTMAYGRGCDQYLEKPRNYNELNTSLPKTINYWLQKKNKKQ